MAPRSRVVDQNIDNSDDGQVTAVDNQLHADALQGSCAHAEAFNVYFGLQCFECVGGVGVAGRFAGRHHDRKGFVCCHHALSLVNDEHITAIAGVAPDSVASR